MRVDEKYLDEIFDQFSPNYAGELDESVMSRAKFKEAIAAMKFRIYDFHEESGSFDQEKLNRMVTAIPDYKMGIMFPFVSGEMGENEIFNPIPNRWIDAVPNIGTNNHNPFKNIGNPKDFIDHTIPKLTGDLGEYKAILPKNEEMSFLNLKEYKGIELEFTDRVSEGQFFITHKDNKL